MKFSKNWLQQWFDEALDTKLLTQELTMAGFEVDEITPITAEFSGVIVAEVIEKKPHPNADRLSLCKVDTGTEILDVVCGANNVRAGLKVAFAQIGAVLPKDFKIRKSKIRDEISMGMICSRAELGLAETAEGIIELPASAPKGMDLKDYLDLNDVCISVDVTPNRGDCLSILGITREVSAIKEIPLKDVPTKQILPTVDDIFPVSVFAPTQCPRYLGRVIRNIRATAETPSWLSERLRRSDLRPIHPLVDVTNYVMLELGQPLHAFDLAALKGGINVRLAKNQEKITLLTGETITLNADTLVIADEAGAVAIAGIMGGENSAATLNTTNVFLESAFFTPEAIAGKARKYGLSTDAAQRFERGVDPELPLRALERATELILEICGGKPGPVIDQTERKTFPAKKVIAFDPSKSSKILGITLPIAKIENLLTRLHLQVNSQAVPWRVTIPSYRFDLNYSIDLVEEVARLNGYDRIPLSYPQALTVKLPYKETQVNVEQIRSALVQRGYNEVYTYSFVDPDLQKCIQPETPPLKLTNPITADMAVMRTSLWAGLLQAVKYNQHRQQKRLRLFEIGQRFVNDTHDLKQQPMVAGVITDLVYPEQWALPDSNVDFFDIKADVEALLDLTGYKHDYVFEKSQHSALHPGQASKLIYNGKEVGWVGALHPRVQQNLKLMGPVMLFECQLEMITKAKLPAFEPISKFPSIRRDLAVVLNESISAAEIENVVRSASNELLVSFHIFDVYTGQGVPAGKKSMAIALTLQHLERTLVDDEVNRVINRVVNALQEQLQASLRE